MQGSIYISGLDALFYASLDSYVARITAVAGFPVTALASKFLEEEKGSSYTAHWFTNEKSAMETALGASVSGSRSLVLVKHVGMNLLADPLLTSVLHTIGAGVVIIAGDDPAALGSQNEQDSRWYGELAEVMVFDPSCPQTAYSSLIEAFGISEEASVPVIIRVTDRLLKSVGHVRRISPSPYSSKRFDPSVWLLTMHGKHQQFHLRSHPLMVQRSLSSPLNRISISGSIGIISSGMPAAIVDGLRTKDQRWSDVSHLAIATVSPFPYELVADFIRQHHRVLVVEESEPFIESHIRIVGNVYGKASGHLPHGIIEEEHIIFALETLDEEHIVKYSSVQTIAQRGSRPICDNCPFMPLYQILRRSTTMVAGDMGCSIRAAPAPLNAVDTAFSLGGSISTACGFPAKGIALIGDFGLAHSGIIGLINAVDHSSDVLVIVLDNSVAAMTGGQPVPVIKEMVAALVPKLVTFDMDVVDQHEGEALSKELEALISDMLDEKGVSLLYVKGRCLKY